MPDPVLTRFEVLVSRIVAGNLAPYPGAQVSLFRQGASSAQSLTIPTGSSTLTVYSVGDIAINDVVTVGVDGPELTVTAINVATRTLTIQNSTGSGIPVQAGVRLIPTANRPVAYADPIGTVSSGSDLTADSSGRVAFYVAPKRFDYTTRSIAKFIASAVALLEDTNQKNWSITGESVNLTNDHYAFVVLAGSFDEPTGITYGGVNMSLLVATGALFIYYVSNPPVGNQTVNVQYENNVQVVATAIYTAGSLAPVTQTASGSSTTPSVAVTNVPVSGFVFDALFVSSSTSVTATVGSGQTQRWHQFITGVLGAGSTEAGTGGTTTMSWTLSASKSWRQIGVKIAPSLTPAINPDAQAGAVPTPNWLNVREFGNNIQAAIDALPLGGGTVYVPAGIYEISSAIVIPKDKTVSGVTAPHRVHLIGDGIERTIIKSTSTSNDILQVKGTHSRIERLTLQGPASSGNGRGIVIGRPGVNTLDIMRFVAVVDCQIKETAGWGIYVLGESDTENEHTINIWTHFERVDVTDNASQGGIHISDRNTTQFFTECVVHNFKGIAAEVVGAYGVAFRSCTFERRLDSAAPYVVANQCNSFLMDHCWFETHEEEDVDEYFIDIGAGGTCNGVAIRDCHFTRSDGGLPMLVKVQATSLSVAIENPECLIGSLDGGEREDIGIFNGSAVTLAGGVVYKRNTPAGPQQLSMSSVGSFVSLGTNARVGLLKLNPTEIAALEFKRPGDLVYNTGTVGTPVNRPQFWDGTNWRTIDGEAL